MRWIVIAAALCAPVGTAWAENSARDASAELAKLALEKNPSLAAAAARIRGLDARVRKAGAWLDPKVAIEYSNAPIDSWQLGDHPMSGLQFKLQQTFIFPGKTKMRQEVAKGQAREQRIALEERKVQLRAAIKRAYYSLALVRQLKSVTESHIKLLAQFIDAVRIKYEVGKVGQHDLLRLQVLHGKLRDDLKGFERDDRALTASINATLQRAVGVKIATPERISPPPPMPTQAELVVEATRGRPLLRFHLEQARTRRAAAKQATKEGYPDLTTWIGYRVRTRAGADAGTDFFSVGLSFPLPLFNQSRWGSQKREQEALAKAAEAQRKAELDRLRALLAQHIAAWKRATQQAQTYREKLMPQARRVLDATFGTYQVGRADFSSLFQAEIQLLEFERTIRRAEAKAALARVEVEALTGREIRSWRRK